MDERLVVTELVGDGRLERAVENERPPEGDGVEDLDLLVVGPPSPEPGPEIELLPEAGPEGLGERGADSVSRSGTRGVILSVSDGSPARALLSMRSFAPLRMT